MHTLINKEITKLIQLLTTIRDDHGLQKNVIEMGGVCINALRRKNKILLIGNGGSAADCQHLAAELVSRLRFNRPGLPAIALTTDTSALTAIGNDYSFENLFSRQVEALGQPGDVLIAISTSGKSPNILKAMRAAKEREMKVIGFCGAHTASMSESSDLLLSIPSTETPKIQECHITFGHIICALIEDELFGAEYDPLKQSQMMSA